MSMVIVVHAKVPGRARFRVEGLYGNQPLKYRLESGLRRIKGVIEATGSTLSGRILVFFDQGIGVETMIDHIRTLLQEPIYHYQDATAAAGHHPDDFGGLDVDNPERSLEAHWPGAITRGLKRLGFWVDRPPDDAWITMDNEQIGAILETDFKNGLDFGEAADRRHRYGPNILPETAGRSRWRIFIDQFKSLPVALLGIAAGVSIFTGGWLDAAVIMGVVAANAVIGYFTESSAEKTIKSLKDNLDPTAMVRREGREMELRAEDLVIGDVVVLRPGAYVSADCRVIEAGNLSLDESTLTGESMPVTKTGQPLAEVRSSLAEQENMVFMGTLVTGGQGVAVVVATGRHTEIGKLQRLLDLTEAPKTPIERQLGEVGDHLVISCMAICAVVFLVGFLRGQGLMSMLRTSIALAAAAVPEGLPAAATTTFALGVKRMRAHNVLVRNIEAVETLGAVQVVCLDKTGTITHNRMTVQKLFAGGVHVDVRGDVFSQDGQIIDPAHSGVKKLIRTGVLCNESEINGHDAKGWHLDGSPTENALVNLALKAGFQVEDIRSRYQRTEISHRAENRHYMSTLHTKTSGRRFLAVKGSPGEVLDMCTSQYVNGEVTPLSDDDRKAVAAANERMSGQALRVLGVAYFKSEPGESDPVEKDLIWLGLVGMADPIRDGVKELIVTFHRAGIDTVMITGDQKATACAVAEELGLSRNGSLVVVDVSEALEKQDDNLAGNGHMAHVYARVSPAQKLNIVKALQEAGLVVAMTGDGINDSPALKAAEVGVAMGRDGTDVARDVADLVLQEDDLESLVVALRDGRTTRNNIKKSVHFFLSTNMSEIMVMGTALTLGLGAPMNTMQLLWINLISDIFPGLALSLEKPEPDILEQPPRDPQSPLFSRREYKRMAFESAAISAASLGAYGFGLARYGAGAQAMGLAFQSLTIGQLLHAVSCRSPKRALFSRLQPNPHLTWALGGSLLIQALTIFVPGLRNFLGLAPLTLVDGAVIAGAAVAPLLFNEATKSWRREKVEAPKRVKPIQLIEIAPRTV